MEPYQYWTIAGFIFLFFELITLRTLPLVLAGSAFFTAVIAFKFPEEFLIQGIVCFVAMPFLFFAIKPYIKNKFKRHIKNEHK